MPLFTGFLKLNQFPFAISGWKYVVIPFHTYKVLTTCKLNKIINIETLTQERLSGVVVNTAVSGADGHWFDPW